MQSQISHGSTQNLSDAKIWKNKSEKEKERKEGRKEGWKKKRRKDTRGST